MGGNQFWDQFSTVSLGKAYSKPSTLSPRPNTSINHLGKAKAKEAKKELSIRKVKVKIVSGSVQSRFKNRAGRYRLGRLRQREVKEELSDRKVKIKNSKGAVQSRFKHLLGRYRLGRLRQREVKKELSIRKVKIKNS